MPLPDLIIRGPRVVLPDTIGPRSIHIREGKIVSITDYDRSTVDCEVIDVERRVSDHAGAG